MEPHSGLNNLDFIVLGILLLSGVLAMFRGFVREVLSLVSWTIAYFIAAKYHYLAEPWVHHHIRNEKGAALAAGFGIFLIVLLICAIISNIIVGLVRGKALNAIDRSLGFGFGLLRGVLVVCIVYLAAAAIMWPDMDKPSSELTKESRVAPDWIMEARTRPWLSRGAIQLKAFIPEKDLQSATLQLDEGKNHAQHVIDEKTLNMLSTPTPAAKDATAPSYEPAERSGLDQLVNQKGKQP